MLSKWFAKKVLVLWKQQFFQHRLILRCLRWRIATLSHFPQRKMPKRHGDKKSTKRNRPQTKSKNCETSTSMTSFTSSPFHSMWEVKNSSELWWCHPQTNSTHINSSKAQNTLKNGSSITEPNSKVTFGSLKTNPKPLSSATTLSTVIRFWFLTLPSDWWKTATWWLPLTIRTSGSRKEKSGEILNLLLQSQNPANDTFSISRTDTKTIRHTCWDTVWEEQWPSVLRIGLILKTWTVW